jgi:hypothetical protein
MSLVRRSHECSMQKRHHERGWLWSKEGFLETELPKLRCLECRGLNGGEESVAEKEKAAYARVQMPSVFQEPQVA